MIFPAIASGLLATSASAVTIYTIGSDNSFYSFDSAVPSVVTQVGAAGSAAGYVDLDVYGANGSLYGITASGSGASINLSTGASSGGWTPNTNPITGAVNAFDFNPAADRVRVISNGGTNNYRVQPDFASAPQTITNPGGVTVDGGFNFTSSTGTLRPGIFVLGAGYTNPGNNPASTILYTLSSDGFLNSHTTPAGSFGDGVAIGAAGLGFTPTGSGFDIDLEGIGYAIANSDGVSNLYAIDLTTGVGTLVGAVGTTTGLTFNGLAAVPEPSTALLGALAGLALLRRRRI
ncbi:DUF4394 domain-containing protein [Luteolibacter flavescens]|uniref:DUF4394 domain-containing protein n=1 Tax=Luteolibacter flavescens TaxID=1859460 RepID=A0ABT3FQU9_9BACT|nr:DUF4394 domain-containing protein [Luteolibacter flavescens]MCW1885606.1 DUF4394 domain-containing protein [Luteolibacter flavescens]